MCKTHLKRIEAAFGAAARVIDNMAPGAVNVRHKAGGDIVTELDRSINIALEEVLHQPGEGWLSEESPDTADRLDKARVWIVDPLDGTREFVAGRSEWAVSVGLIEDGRLVAGGVWNPAKQELFLGGPGFKVTCNGVEVAMSPRTDLKDAHVLASRSEMTAGLWKGFGTTLRIDPVGSIAYKLALVAAGRADGTWTMWPRHEWDIAGGAALVLGAGGSVLIPDGTTPRFNQPEPRVPGILAANSVLAKKLLAARNRGSD